MPINLNTDLGVASEKTNKQIKKKIKKIKTLSKLTLQEKVENTHLENSEKRLQKYL